jgi:A/G-specific adenine glycosylase
MSKKLTQVQIQKFQKDVWEYYNKRKRNLPWRGGRVTPYHVLVSEFMLQQTQVSRVVLKYGEFIKRFPSMQSLASAHLSDILVLWQGLGYNRRAKALYETAKIIVSDHNGKVPQDRDELIALPGIGPYTAGAIRAFGFNEPEIFIDTNIRTVYLRHFFPKGDQVDDKEILEIVERTVDRTNARSWYEALMDYGAYIKQTYINENVRSRHYTKQSKFNGSTRQLRGLIMKLVLEKGGVTVNQIAIEAERSVGEVKEQIKSLLNEGLLAQEKNVFKSP